MEKVKKYRTAASLMKVRNQHVASIHQNLERVGFRLEDERWTMSSLLQDKVCSIQQILEDMEALNLSFEHLASLEQQGIEDIEDSHQMAQRIRELYKSFNALFYNASFLQSLMEHSARLLEQGTLAKEEQLWVQQKRRMQQLEYFFEQVKIGTWNASLIPSLLQEVDETYLDALNQTDTNTHDYYAAKNEIKWNLQRTQKAFQSEEDHEKRDAWLFFRLIIIKMEGWEKWIADQLSEERIEERIVAIEKRLEKPTLSDEARVQWEKKKQNILDYQASNRKE